jgi:sterol desaturase/sphingolipid hydroxylase (fatty acid hydroxylase superfamily)
MNAYLSQLNLIAIIVATIFYFILGSLWYSPVLFGKTWTELQRIDPEKMEASKGRLPIMLSVTFVLSFIICVAIALLTFKTGVDTFLGGIKMGLLCAAGFVFTTLGITFMFEGKPMKLFVIDAGYHATGILVAAILLAVWK